MRLRQSLARQGDLGSARSPLWTTGASNSQLFLRLVTFAARRGGAQNLPVSKNDAIFCNFNFKEIGIAKNGIVFPIFNFFEIGN
jgi:hypothetical protein